MSIASVLLMPRLSMPAQCRCDDKKNFEQEVPECPIWNDVSRSEQQEAAKEPGETYIVESTDNVEFYFVWPIPLVFDEFTVD